MSGKHIHWTLVLVLALGLNSRFAPAHEYDKDDSDHPLRYVAYALHPIGVAVEYVVLRPTHEMVSQPVLHDIFGHQPFERDWWRAQHDPLHAGVMEPVDSFESQSLSRDQTPAAPPVQAEEPMPEPDLESVYFDFDSAELTEAARAELERIAAELRRFPDKGLMVEGHCDERGSEQYNLLLGWRRAEAVQAFLEHCGVAADRIRIVSLGEREPAVEGHQERAWASNRRAEFRLLLQSRSKE